jgi:hypothetical protein
MTLEEKVRRRLWLSLSPTTAGVIGCHVPDLQQFLVKQVTFSEVQLIALARYLGVK